LRYVTASAPPYYPRRPVITAPIPPPLIRNPPAPQERVPEPEITPSPTPEVTTTTHATPVQSRPQPRTTNVMPIGINLQPPAPERELTETLRVNFAYDSDVLTPSERNRVLGFIRLYPRALFTLVGHASTEGDTQHNQDLAQRRINSTVRAIRESGYTGTLASQDRGELDPVLSPNGAEDRVASRRVDLTASM
jgi:outer membrane protein OmpA-like peptidoglycan-associated protein